jgi:putative transposase
LAQKKISVAAVEKKKAMVDPDYPMIPISRQCDLLGFARSSFYYDSQRDDTHNLMLMNRIDEQFTETPFYGVPKMAAWLRAVGYPVNPKRIRRLMRRMGLEAIYPKPRTSAGGPDHKIYPYLLKGVPVNRLDQAWVSDITYIRLAHGLVYLDAIMDWHSRYILSWEFSIALEKEFLPGSLEEGAVDFQTGDLQFGPGGAVYKRGIYGAPGRRRSPD